MSDEQDQDVNQDAARTVRESTGKHEQPLPADVEAAWAEWSLGLRKVDERTLTLIRAAFEAGWDAGAVGGAAATGRAGGLKGGKARAEALSPEQRAEIAKKAASKRWGND